MGNISISDKFGATVMSGIRIFFQLPGGSLWFPSSQIEAQFVIDHLWSQTGCDDASDKCTLTLGLKAYSDSYGWMAMDNSIIPGIPLITSETGLKDIYVIYTFVISR